MFCAGIVNLTRLLAAWAILMGLACEIAAQADLHDEVDSNEASQGTFPAEATQGGLRISRNVTMSGPKGLRLQIDVYRPDDDTQYPMILMIHGGAWSTGDKWNLGLHAKELAKAGFVVVANNYRLAPKYKYPVQLDDCRAALKWSREHAQKWNADASRVGFWGYSAGGQLAALLALQPDASQPKPVACVIGGAPSEFSFLPRDSKILAHVMGGTPEEKPEVYRQASAIEFVSKDACPFFLFHGTADFLVPYSASQKMLAALKEHGVESELHTVVNQGHLIAFMDATARRQAVEFLTQQFAEQPKEK